MRLFNSSVFKSIAGSVIFKLSSAVISFAVVPMTLGILGKEDYAIWATATSLLAWIALFDFGVGYSLKNKVSEYIALNESNKLFETIAATLQFLILTIAVLLVLFLISFLFVDIFKDQPVLMVILYLPFILSFPTIGGNFILQGQGKFNLFNCLQIIQPIVWIVFIYLGLKGYFKANLFVFAIVYSTSLLLIRVVTLVIALKKIHFPFRYLRNYNLILQLRSIVISGSKFFVLQICSLAIYSMGNLLIYAHLNLTEVAQYDIINKIFLLGMTIFNIVIAVFWTEISKAKALMDITKLKKIHRYIYLFSILSSVVSISLIYICPVFIPLWTKNMIHVTSGETIPFVILFCIQSLGYAGAVFLNAFEKLRGQIIMAVISAVLIIPVAKIFFNMKMGIDAIPLSAAVLTLPAVIFCYIKSRECIYKLAAC